MWKNHKTKFGVASLSLQMSAGYAGFVYFRKDRTMRVAVGTTNLDLIPVGQRPKGHTEPQQNLTPWIQKYFDFKVGGWRSYDRHRLAFWFPLDKNDPEVAELIDEANKNDGWNEAVQQMLQDADTFYEQEQMEVELPEPTPTPTPRPG